ncbi:MAG TPA: hypothetical protein VNI58_05455 [Mariprofundaceae bacterium]|nr:hypothetical protein [Mariprofundaceae bacterium]
MRKQILAWLLPCMLVAAPVAQAASVETTDELKTLKEQVRLLQQKIDKMETRLQASEKQPAAAAPAEPVVQAAESAQPQNTTRSDANVFNPQISMVLNGSYRAFSHNPATFAVPGFALGDSAGLGDRGFGINESELNFAANVDNLFYADSTLSLPRTGGINVEEAYFQTLALPAGLTVKAGRFFSGIGYINQFHPHHDDFIDRSLANRVFLNSTFAGDGIQVRWLAPTDTYFELGSELLRGDRYPGGGAALRGAGSWDVFAHVGGDVGFSNSWRAGLSWLSTKPLGRSSFDNTGAVTGTFDGNSQLLIGDLVWKWAPNGNPYDTNFKFQTELFQQQEKGMFANAGSPAASYSGRHWGGYAEAVYQFTHGWDIGIRHSEVFARNTGAAVVPGSVLDTLGFRPKRTSLVLGYANSEFSRFRLQFSRDQSRPVTDNQVALQYLMLIGAHGAHQF